MFGNWLQSAWPQARARAAENALADGRLDDAYRHVRDAGRPPPASLCDRLAAGLLARVRLAVSAGRFADALADLVRLEELGARSGESDALRDAAERELRERADRDAARDAAVLRARGRIEAGRLESVRLEVDRLDDPRQRAALREKIEIREQRSRQLLEQARHALNEGQELAACRFWCEAIERHGRSRLTDDFAAEMLPTLLARVDAWLREGRLERAEALLGASAGLGEFDARWGELVRFTALARRAAAALPAARCEDVRDALRRMQSLRPELSWVPEALSAAESAAGAYARLIAGPLGALDASLRSPQGIVTGAAPAARDHAGGDFVSAATAGAPRVALDAPLLLLVDGVGSALIVGRPVVRLGRAGAGSNVEAPLPGAIQSHHADVVYDGEDYFLAARGPARVNREDVQRRLLRDGDRITLGDAVRMTFSRPSARSETAVLRLSDRCRLPQDVSSVVLFRGTLLIGPQAAAHLRTRDGRTQLVVFERDGALFVRVVHDDLARDAAAAPTPLPIGQTRDFEEMRLTLKPYVLEKA